MLVDLASMYQTKYGSVLYGGLQQSRQNQKPHGKNKIRPGKTKKPHGKNKIPHGKTKKPHGKNKIPHCKTKNLTAKPSTSQQKQNSFSFAVGFCFFSQYLVLP